MLNRNYIFNQSRRFYSSPTRERLRKMARSRVYKDVKRVRDKYDSQSRITCFGWIRLGNKPVRRLHRQFVSSPEDWKEYMATTTKWERLVDSWEIPDMLGSFRLRVFFTGSVLLTTLSLIFLEYLSPDVHTKTQWWEKSLVTPEQAKEFNENVLAKIADDPSIKQLNYSDVYGEGMEISPLHREERIKAAASDVYIEETNQDDNLNIEDINIDNLNELPEYKPFSMDAAHKELLYLAEQEQKLRDSNQWEPVPGIKDDGKVHIVTPLFGTDDWTFLGILRRLKFLPERYYDHGYSRFPSKMDLQVAYYKSRISENLSFLDFIDSGFDPRNLEGQVKKSVEKYNRELLYPQNAKKDDQDEFNTENLELEFSDVIGKYENEYK